MNQPVQLALVESKMPRTPKNQYSPRPIKVFYTGGGVGHCKTLRSGIAAAVRHMMAFNTRKVTMTYEDVPVADIVWAGQEIKVKWVRLAVKLF